MSDTAELDDRRVRAAKNQSLLREVNERIEELAGGNASIFEELRRSRTIDLACECMDETCTERVTMTIGEYEQVRAGSNSFLVLPGHDVPEVEEIAREEPAYAVVSKLGVGAAVAEKLDPRKRSRCSPPDAPLDGAREWACACSQQYRVAAVNGETRFWPRNSVNGYSRQGLTVRSRCIRCARPLRLDDH